MVVVPVDQTLSFASSDSATRTVRAPLLTLAVAGGDVRAAVGRFSLTGVDRVALGRGPRTGVERVSEESERGTEAVLRISIADAWMSTRHAELVRAGDGWMIRDHGSKNGTFVAGRGIAESPLHEQVTVIEVGSSFLVWRVEDLELAELGDRLLVAGQEPLSLAYARVRARADAIAPSDVPVVLAGESGTGKEVLARRIHERSGRSGRFAGINCGAVPDGLLESSLFGHRRGAFSGAVADSPGVFRGVEGGTLLLDEIGELSAAAQVKLLRVLQEREVLPVGEHRAVPIDVRVLAASHRNLQGLVDEERFRQDLFMRLAGLTLELPPLRERLEDIGGLVASFHARDGATSTEISRPVLRQWFAYPWPGNIRELEQVVATASQLARGSELQLEHMPGRLRDSVGESAGPELRQELVDALARHRGNVSAVARELGKARVQIRRWCKRLGIDVDAYR